MYTDPTRGATGKLCVAMAVVMVIVGLWPFSFLRINQVHWLKGRPGLQFRPDGLAYDLEPLPKTPRESTLDRPAAFTVELWVEPDLEPHDRIHHLLTIYDKSLPSNLVLCQWKTELILRYRQDGTSGFREAYIAGALEKQKARLITLTCSPGGTLWYFDGHRAKTSPGATVGTNSLYGRLILGDAPEGKHAWSGRFYGLAIFARALGAEEVLKHSEVWANHQAARLAGEAGLVTLLTFDEGQGHSLRDRSPYRQALLIPHWYRVVHKEVLVWPSKLREANLQDVWINLLGFMPFGFLAYWHHRSSHRSSWLASAAVAALSGATISPFIELAQVWLPSRYSSSLDLGCNILGTALGVCAAILVRPNAPHPEESIAA